MNLDADFVKEFKRLSKKYGETFKIMNGFADSQLNYTDFIDHFVKEETLADASIDGNANVSHKDVVTLMNEMSKPHSKLLAANKIFYEMKKKYGLADARKWLEMEWDGHYYLHDFYSSSMVSYCYAYDLDKLAREGLYFIDNFNHLPPKHLLTFVDFVGEFVSYACNRTSGAVGLPSFLVYAYYFWKKDIDEGYLGLSWDNKEACDKYAEQAFQVIIYRLNQPFLRNGIQSAFTNFSIFDPSYFEALFGGKQFPDGSFMIDIEDDFMEFQKKFMGVCSEIRKVNMMTFPVLSISILKDKNTGKFINEDFAKWACKHNMKWGDSNFFISSDVTSLSNCPVAPDTKILYWSDRYKRFCLSEIKDIYYRRLKAVNPNAPIKVLSNGNLIDCKINKFDESPNYVITLTNGAVLKTTAHHLNKAYGKDYVETKDLTADDYLPYSIKPYVGNGALTYEEGKLVGMFLGDGSYSNDNSVVFSLNADTDQDDVAFLREYCAKRFGAEFNEHLCESALSGKKKCLNFCVKSDYLRGLVKQFVFGDSALSKELNLYAIQCSVEFRKGIIDGLYTTDGNKNGEDCNRIYTSSEKLKDSLVALFGSLGLVTKIYVDSRDGRLGSNLNYSIRWFTPKGKTKRKDSYILDDEYMWIKIKSVEKIDIKVNESYCLEVLDPTAKPEFMLGNGILTHNCRLVSNVQNLGYFNSIGATALEVGSVKVNTINLERIAFEHQNQDEYIEALKGEVDLDCKVLSVIRHIIERNIEKGLLPNYTHGLIHLKNQYNTIGIIGVYETLKKFGLTRKDELGYTSYTDEGMAFAKRILATINECKEAFRKREDSDYMVNVEQVPGERAAAVLQEKDRQLFPDEDYELPLLGNQWIPLGVKCTLDEKIRDSAELDKACNGGSIAHINLEAPLTDFDTAWKLLNYISDKGVTYFAFNLRISACKHNHGFFGETCPVCGEPKETTYQRIVGFLVPEKSYSKERKAEFKLRDWYEIDQKGEVF